MNRAASLAVESNIASASSDTDRKERQRRAIFAAKNRQSDPEALSWMEDDQLDAEMEFMVAEIANKQRREYRRSLSR